MKKIIAVVLLLSASSFAISPFTWSWNIKLTGDTATVTKWKNNNDSVRLWNVKVADTLNKGVPRWVAFKNHDSTFNWMNIDTIPSADTIRTTAISGVRATFTGTAYVDSLYSTKGIKATTFTGNLLGNATGDVTGNVTGSSGSCTGNSATAAVASSVNGTLVTATTGTFSARIGVGTTSPIRKIDVRGGTNNTADWLGLTSSTALFDAYASNRSPSVYGDGLGLLFLGRSGLDAGERTGSIVWRAEDGNTAPYTRAYLLFSSCTNMNLAAPVTGMSGAEMCLVDGKMGIGTVAPTSPLHVVGLPIYADNAAAAAAGRTAGALYRTGGDPDVVCVVH